MRRFTATLCLFCFTVVLASCKRSSEFKPEEVLVRAEHASRELQSASFSGNATHSSENVEGTKTSGDVSFTGRMQQSGTQLQFAFNAKALVQPKEGDAQKWIVQAESIIEGEQEIYFNIHTFSVEPLNPVFSSPFFTQLQNSWWKLPSSGSGVQMQQVSPDPRLLRMQTEVVDVKTDLGMTTIRGRDAYHYVVVLDKNKLTAFEQEIAKEEGKPSAMNAWTSFMDHGDIRGELWIDRQTFSILALQWTIQDNDQGHAVTQFHVDLSDFNSAQPILPPADAKDFELPSLMSQPSDVSLPPLMTLPQETQDALNGQQE